MRGRRSGLRRGVWWPSGVLVAWTVAGWRGSLCCTQRSPALRTLTSAAMHLPRGAASPPFAAARVRCGAGSIYQDNPAPAG